MKLGMSQAWSFSRSGEVDPFAEQQAQPQQSWSNIASRHGSICKIYLETSWQPDPSALTYLLPAVTLHRGTCSFPQLLVLVALLWRWQSWLDPASGCGYVFLHRGGGRMQLVASQSIRPHRQYSQPHAAVMPLAQQLGDNPWKCFSGIPRMFIMSSVITPETMTVTLGRRRKA